jgi:hypothetical protein
MKRFALVLAAAFALAIPAGAFGNVFYKGSLPSPNAVVELRAKFHDGGPRKIIKFSYANVPWFGPGVCYPISNDFTVSWKVNEKGKFHGAADNGSGQKVQVSGKFKHSDGKIVGTFDVKGPQGSCDTGDVDYTAKRGG